ncbi:MAG TPA: primosomal protein N', partial [Thermogutta sp.]|nr:primosomal protein N' [Thermogutta sp.]
LVGVVNADTALHFPDFRASERTFQLVTQVAGRTGRGPHGGQVLVQTFTPEHPAIQAAIRHDYETFAQQELKVREAFGYPPFWRLARIVVSSNSSETAEACSREFAASVHTQAEVAGLTDKIRIVGPAPAPLAKLRGKYRYHLQVMARDYPQLLSVISTAQKTCRAPSGVTWTIDVDPIDML